jgi:hypothetical protein
MEASQRISFIALVSCHILENCFTATGCNVGIFHLWWGYASHTIAGLTVFLFEEYKASKAIASVVTNLIFTGSTFSTLMTLAVIDVSANQLHIPIHIRSLLNFIARQAVACVIHVLINADTIGTTRMSNTVIDWHT